MSLEAVMAEEAFVEVDVALRRGRHIDRDDEALYEFIVAGQPFLEAFYRRYGCDLVAQADGYYYLLPRDQTFRKRRLLAGEMLVGQTLALLYLDPARLKTAGTIERSEVLDRLAGLLSIRELAGAFSPNTRKFDDERAIHEMIRMKVTTCLRHLSELGFVDFPEVDQLYLRAPVLRFTEPVHGLGDISAALERLISEGKVELEGESTDGDGQESVTA